MCSIEQRRTVSQQNFFGPIFEGETPLKKQDPQKWRGYYIGAITGILLTNNDIILTGTTNTTYTIITNQEEEGLKGPDKE